MRFDLATPGDFDFRSAVCSHGFFVLAPNVWDPDRRSLSTVITLDETAAVSVVIRERGDKCAPRKQHAAGACTGLTEAGSDREVGFDQAAGRKTRPSVSVECSARLSSGQRAQVREAVCRMLRLDEDLSPFHQLCRRFATHRAAARMRFGRLLRSATLFEDVVKVICTCNTSWSQTVAMVERIVAHWGVAASSAEGGRGTADGARGFPTPARLAGVSVEELRAGGRLGYRAAFVHRLAREVADGRIDLAAIEQFTGPSEALYRMLRCIHGVGDYAAAHLCMLLGRYDRLAIDTELRRFLVERHPRRKLSADVLRHSYDAWQPYQFLAYWFDLWSGYTRRHGQSDQWSPTHIGRRITR